ncbi:MAG: hypothetical protein LBH05_07590, partial [Deferribacteraceae bacterium]|nr:hypothetical protein [Deferribacteraceae bacterium]
MNDITLKIISVFIAVAMWIYVYSSEKKEVSVRIPVTVTGEREDTMATFHPEEVTVRIYGPQTLVSKENIINDVNLVINLRELPFGSNIIKLSRNDIKGGGVEVLDIIPNRIEINVDPTIKKTLPVLPIIMDEPPKGFKINSITVMPQKVETEGIQNAVLSLKNLQTETVSVTNLKNKGNYNVGFLEYDGIKRITPESVILTIDVTEDIVSRTFNNVRLTCVAGTFVRFTEMPEVNVMVSGRRDRVESLTPDKLLTPVDCEIIKIGGNNKVTPVARTIDNITVNEINP